jgi:rhomboid protease GluP
MTKTLFFDTLIPSENLSGENILVYSVVALSRLNWTIEKITTEDIHARVISDLGNPENEVHIEFSANYGKIWISDENTLGKTWADKFINEFNSVRNGLSSNEYDQQFEYIRKLTGEPTEEQQVSLLTLLKPSKNYIVTPVLLYINVAIFILMVISGVDFLIPSSPDLVAWGANYKPMTLAGEWWRLITSCFLHIGIIHLLFNMYALLQIGYILESLLGRSRFLITYFITGIAGSITSAWWHDNAVSAGASGALFGMFGFYIALLTTNLIKNKSGALKSMLFMIGYNLIIGIQAGFDNAAHIGGLLAGAVIAYVFYFQLRYPSKFGTARFTGLVAIISIGLLSTAYFSIPNSIGEYQQKMKEYATLEEEALSVFNHASSDEQHIQDVRIKGINNWLKANVILEDIDEIDLSPELKERHERIKRYNQLRLQYYELYEKAYSKNDSSYNEELAVIDNEIRTIIESLNK